MATNRGHSLECHPHSPVRKAKSMFGLVKKSEYDFTKYLNDTLREKYYSRLTDLEDVITRNRRQRTELEAADLLYRRLLLGHYFVCKENMYKVDTVVNTKHDCHDVYSHKFYTEVYMYSKIPSADERMWNLVSTEDIPVEVMVHFDLEFCTIEA